MLSIIPARELVSRRLPTASFAVRVPPHRPFEIAFATDPRLFGGGARSLRSPETFYTSSLRGWIFTPNGRASYVLPPDVLLRLAWARRVYYVLASYESTRTERGIFAPIPGREGALPFLRVSPDILSGSRRPEPFRAAVTAPPGAAFRWGGDAPFARFLGEDDSDFSIEDDTPRGGPATADAKLADGQII